MLFLALGDAKVPDARYFAFWWNIGLCHLCDLRRYALFCNYTLKAPSSCDISYHLGKFKDQGKMSTKTKGNRTCKFDDRGDPVDLAVNRTVGVDDFNLHSHGYTIPRVGHRALQVLKRFHICEYFI